MRGLPGSGKTTFANQLVEAADRIGYRAVICSADRFFVGNDGVYRFRHHDLAAAHAFCRNQFDDFMALNRGDDGYADIIIVDNTSIRLFEYEYYKRAALDGNEVFTTYVMRCDNHAEALRQNARSVHQVPHATVLGRFDTFERDDDYDVYINPIYEG